MKTLRENEYVILLIRLVLGFIFIVASIDKIADPNMFAISIVYYKIVGPNPALVIATILPWVELLCGVFLIFGIMLRGSSFLILLMLVVFTLAVLSGIIRGLDISCGCFTRDPNVDRIGWQKMAENAGLLLLSILTFFSNSNKFAVSKPSSDPKTETSNDQ